MFLSRVPFVRPSPARVALACLSLAWSAALAPASAQGFALPYDDEDPSQVFDWYAPAGTGGPYPVVVFIHGGGMGTKEDAAPVPGNLSDLCLRNGVAILSVDYHPFPQFQYPVQLHDVATAVQFFREHAPAYDIDPQRLAIWGVSAGAIMGGWLAYGADLADPAGTPQEQQSTRPQALVNVSGLTNFLLMSPNYPSFFGGGATLGDLDPAFLESISVSELVLDVPRAFTPPVVSFYGLNENPPPLTDPHDVTLMKDLHQHLQAFPEAWAASLMLQKSLTSQVNFSDKLAAWVLQRLAVPHQLDVGGALAGTAGIAPTLAATGSWTPGGAATLTFHTSTGQAAGSWLVVGKAAVHLPFKGGVLVPEPMLVVPVQPAADGSLVIDAVLPTLLVPGNEFYLQCWQVDAGGPSGFAASNAVLATIAP